MGPVVHTESLCPFGLAAPGAIGSRGTARDWRARALGPGGAVPCGGDGRAMEATAAVVAAQVLAAPVNHLVHIEIVFARLEAAGQEPPALLAASFPGMHQLNSELM